MSFVLVRRHALVALLLSAVVATTTAGDDVPPPFKVTTRRDSDRVEVKAKEGKATFVIHCPVGISYAAIERRQETWPEAVILQLHLKGLERFQVSGGKMKLEAAISGHKDQRQWKDGKDDSPLDFDNPYWMRIRMIGGDGKPAKENPLLDGIFEIVLPKAFFESNPKSITVGWVDFYRN